MSKKPADPYQPKMTRNDRFAQMSHQEKVIEQKRKEILAKIEAKQKSHVSTASSSTPAPVKRAKSPPEKVEVKTDAGVNVFSNDGSFMDTFRQLKDKKRDSKLKSFRGKDNYDKHYSEQRGSKSSRWSQKRRSPSPKDKNSKHRISRFTVDKPISFEQQKITINPSFNNSISHANFDNPQISISPQNVTGQPLLKNILPPPSVVFPAVSSHSNAPVIASAPLLLNVPPPQIVQGPVNNTLILPSSTANVLVSTPTMNVAIPASGLTTVTLPPPSIISSQSVSVSTSSALSVPPPGVHTMELATIPPPNPIQVHNIPPPEPINTLNIPHPAPIQVQNIPTPTTIHLSDIPNPKPLDILTIPTPNDENNVMSDPDFLKNIPPPNKSVPPPNKSVPPPNLPETNVSVPPPNTPCLPPPPNMMPGGINQQSAQTISSQNISAQNMAQCQNILVHTIPPPQTQLQQTLQNLQNAQQMQVSTIATGVPPPNIPAQNTFASVTSISVALPIGVVQSSQTSVSNPIPSLMAQPILPPPGMGVATVNVSCPPPLLHMNTPSPAMQAPPPSFVNQPPPITGQMPPMNIPPPQTGIQMMNSAGMGPQFRDINTGTADYEAMASLGRMVAQCGPGIEDVVKQRKNQDPNMWFLFHKESAAYQQYQQLIEQFKREMSEAQETKYKPEDIYEPEMPIEDDGDQFLRTDIKQEMDYEQESSNKRKRKSRWGDKDTSVPPPSVVMANPVTPPGLVHPVIPLPPAQGSGLIRPVVPLPPAQGPGQVMLSKVTRSDPGLVQYVFNTFGSTNVTDEEWKKAEDHYKINLLYQDMVKKRQALEKLQQAGKNKYDYDSDEDVDGGTWEHKLRDKEMMATQLWAQELNRQAEGKHHIGDFLPPEELKRFIEKSSAGKEGRMPNFSDYKEFKIKEDNIGFKMLQKLGWSQGQGLGSNGAGIVEPINKAASREHNQGLGLGDTDADKEDEYESYRKRMMLAYRFRPNPLNNPRRPYY